MARYQIWDETSDVITPSGDVFTPEQWMDKYPMARRPEVYLVISTGVINGAVCNEYTMFKSIYEQNGCDFTGCTTKEAVLAKIEEFEDQQNAPDPYYVDDNTRMADALEDLVVLTELQQ